MKRETFKNPRFLNKTWQVKIFQRQIGLAETVFITFFMPLFLSQSFNFPL